jgi:hypothetical protein
LNAGEILKGKFPIPGSKYPVERNCSPAQKTRFSHLFADNQLVVLKKLPACFPWGNGLLNGPMLVLAIQS